MTAPTAELTQEHVQRLRSDLPLYARRDLFIRSKPEPGRPSQLITLVFNTAQVLVHAKVERQRRETGRIRALVLKARQEGISTYIGARIYQGCTLWPRRRGMVLADDLDRTAEIFSIYERFDEHAALRPPKVTSRRARELAWSIDSRVTVETARDRDTGRGSTLDYVHASEFASWPYPVETLTGLIDAVPEGAGEIWIESTAKGVGNEFHLMWEAAVAEESEWLAVFLPWWIDAGYALALSAEQRKELSHSLDPWERQALERGIPWEEPGEDLPPVLPSGARWNPKTACWTLTLEQLAWRRRKIRVRDELSFRQENPATADEAFLVSGAPFFDMDALEAARHAASLPMWRGMVRIDWKAGEGPKVPKSVAISRSERGWLRIWEMPEVAHHYVIGADTAEGKAVSARRTSFDDPDAERGDRDFSSADVIRLGYYVGEGEKRRFVPPKQVAQIHARMAPESFGQQLFGLGTLYSCPKAEGARDARERALLAVERNHRSGITTLRVLRELGYDRLFVARPMVARKERPTERIGWLTSGETRRPMLDQLGQAVREGTLEVPCAETVGEMRTFVFADDGEPEAQEGCHDDRVISAAIALEMTRFHHHALAEPEPSELREQGLEPEITDTPTGM